MRDLTIIVPYRNGEEWLDQLDGLSKTYGIVGEGVFDHPAWERGYVQGTYMYIRRDVIDKVGLLNARDYPLWGSTCEYQLRAARQGFLVIPLRNIPGFEHHREGGMGKSIH